MEALILTTIVSGIVGAVFGLTSPPSLIGHGVLALASGVGGGKLIAALHDALVPTRYDTEQPRSPVSVPMHTRAEPRQPKPVAPRAPDADQPDDMGAGFAPKPAEAATPDVAARPPEDPHL